MKSDKRTKQYKVERCVLNCFYLFRITSHPPPPTPTPPPKKEKQTKN